MESCLCLANTNTPSTDYCNFELLHFFCHFAIVVVDIVVVGIVVVVVVGVVCCSTSFKRSLLPSNVCTKKKLNYKVNVRLFQSV